MTTTTSQPPDHAVRGCEYHGTRHALRRNGMSDQLTPDGGTVEESGGETYEELVNLSSDEDE